MSTFRLYQCRVFWGSEARGILRGAELDFLYEAVSVSFVVRARPFTAFFILHNSICFLFCPTFVFVETYDHLAFLPSVFIYLFMASTLLSFPPPLSFCLVHGNYCVRAVGHLFPPSFLRCFFYKVSLGFVFDLVVGGDSSGLCSNSAIRWDGGGSYWHLDRQEVGQEGCNVLDYRGRPARAPETRPAIGLGDVFDYGGRPARTPETRPGNGAQADCFTGVRRPGRANKHAAAAPASASRNR